MVIRAIGRGIASPTAVPRRPPSPSDRATGRGTARSRSPPKKASQQPTRGPPDDVLALLPALPAGPERQEGLEAEEEENEREEVPDTPMQPIIIHPDRVAVEGVEARYSRTLFGVHLLRDEDIAAVDPELLIQLTARAVTPGVRLGTPEFEGHRVVEGFPEVNVAVGAMPEHAQVTGQYSEATDVVHRVSLAGPHVAITGMPWVTREGSRGPEKIAAEMFDLLTQAGFRLAKGRGQGVFVPKTDFRDYATAFVTFAPGEAVAQSLLLLISPTTRPLVQVYGSGDAKALPSVRIHTVMPRSYQYLLENCVLRIESPPGETAHQLMDAIQEFALDRCLNVAQPRAFEVLMSTKYEPQDQQARIFLMSKSMRDHWAG